MRHKQKLEFLHSYIQLKNIEIDSKKRHVFSLRTAADETARAIESLCDSITDTESELRGSMISLRPIDLATRHIKIQAIEQHRNVLSTKKDKHDEISNELELCLQELHKKSKFSDSLKSFEQDLKVEAIVEQNKEIDKEVEELFLMRSRAAYDLR